MARHGFTKPGFWEHFVDMFPWFLACSGDPCPRYITEKYHNTQNITELIPKHFRFGNVFTEIKDRIPKSIRKGRPRDSVILCIYVLPKPKNSRNNRFGNHKSGITENNSKMIKFGSVIIVCNVIIHIKGRPKHDHDPGTPFFGGYLRLPHQMPCLHCGTQRKHKNSASHVPSRAILMRHKMQDFFGIIMVVVVFGPIFFGSFTGRFLVFGSFSRASFFFRRVRALLSGHRQWAPFGHACLPFGVRRGGNFLEKKQGAGDRQTIETDNVIEWHCHRFVPTSSCPVITSASEPAS